MDKSQTVYIVDDDKAVRDSLCAFLEAAGMAVEAFPSAHAMLKAYDPARSGCLLLDIQMPDMSGLHLQEELSAVGATLPIIFITGHADVSSAVKALKSGAYDFLQKPFDNKQLLELISKALDQESKNRAQQQQQVKVMERLDSLTPREREVMDYVVKGNPTKIIASELALSHRTVEIYRANLMHKMQCRSIAQLVRMVSDASTPL